MKILTIHNKYKFRGGEDESRESEDSILMARGHQIEEIVFDNQVIQRGNVIRTGLQATWNPASYSMVRKRILEWPPDIVDIHNFFPLASPSVHYAARSLASQSSRRSTITGCSVQVQHSPERHDMRGLHAA